MPRLGPVLGRKGPLVDREHRILKPRPTPFGAPMSAPVISPGAQRRTTVAPHHRSPLRSLHLSSGLANSQRNVKRGHARVADPLSQCMATGSHHAVRTSRPNIPCGPDERRQPVQRTRCSRRAAGRAPLERFLHLVPGCGQPAVRRLNWNTAAAEANRVAAARASAPRSSDPVSTTLVKVTEARFDKCRSVPRTRS